MRITGRVWQALTDSARLAMLEFASEQNRRRWQKKKAADMAANKKITILSTPS